MIFNFLKIKSLFFDLIFPIECLGCRKEGIWLCKKCLDSIKLISEFSCPFCGAVIKNGEVCYNCKDNFVLDGIIVATTYDNRLLKEALHTLKYKFVPDIAEILGRFLTETIIKQDGFNISEFKLIPIPLHYKRFKERGFNQAEYLSNDLAGNFDLDLSLNLLKRKKNTTNQASLDADQRKENIKDAFVCPDFNNMDSKKVVLIDDVFTTGSTMQEAARTLKKCGCKEVLALALAHGK